MENEHNRKLPFLDVVVDRVNKKYKTFVHCKPTFPARVSVIIFKNYYLIKF